MNNNELIFIDQLKKLLEFHGAKIMVDEDDGGGLMFAFENKDYYLGVGSNVLDPKDKNQLFWTYIKGWKYEENNLP